MTIDRMLIEIAEYEVNFATLSDVAQLAMLQLVQTWKKTHSDQEITDKYNEIFGKNTKDLH